MWIYCDGKKTEKQYFNKVKSGLREVTFQVIPVGGDPYIMVKRAAADTPSNEHLDGDQIWCVFDVEAPETKPKIAEALDLAKEKKINCAISHPCFDLWLLLHFVDQRAYLTTDEACHKLQKYLSGYSARRKHVTEQGYEDLELRHQEARQRAKVLEVQHGDAAVKECNPSTSVWRLSEAIDALYRRS